MPRFICTTCATQYAESSQPPARCSICDEPRQYVDWSGQHWTTHEDLRATHRNTIQRKEPGLTAIGVSPDFGIGQRALFLQTPSGNVLWDCVALLDPGLAEMLHAAGGLSAIAISHPHYYSTMADWAAEFDCPVYLHADDRQWVMRPDDRVVYWEGETCPVGDLTLIRCGGHFAGGAVLHWPEGAEGRGALLTGDIIQVVQDRNWVSFMYSYPNLVPLPARSVQAIVAAVAPFMFDRIYGAFWGKVVAQDARQVVERSAARYLAALQD